LNPVEFQNWLRTIPHLLEGPLSFVKNGIEVTVPWGEKDWDKTGFSIDAEDGTRMWLPLLEREVVFNVHRDVFQKVEWVVIMEDPDE
jgi:hypothetical protein